MTAFLAIAIDDACADIHHAWRDGRAPVSLSLGSTLYAQVLAAREREVLAGAPLLLLDLPVFEDATLAGSAVVVRTAASAAARDVGVALSRHVRS